MSGDIKQHVNQFWLSFMCSGQRGFPSRLKPFLLVERNCERNDECSRLSVELDLSESSARVLYNAFEPSLGYGSLEVLPIMEGMI
jgi:hypothetical protein